MTINEVKKYLYRNKPIASKYHETKDFMFYECSIPNDLLIFKVPKAEGINFKEDESSQLLIRWLLTSTEDE